MDQAYALHLQELDQNLLHPFTHHIAMHGIGTHIVLEGEGCYFRDESGRRVLNARGIVVRERRLRLRGDRRSDQRTNRENTFVHRCNSRTIRVAKFLADTAPSRIKRTIS